MAKPKLKLIEPTLQEQLDAAISAAARLRTDAMVFAKGLAERFPEDRRLIGADLAGVDLVHSELDPLHPSQKSEPVSVSYRRESGKLSDLWQQVREADNAVELLRERIEAAVTEEERRAALGAAIAEAGKAGEALQKVRATISRADDAVADAQERHGDATKAVTAASEAHARLFEAAIEQGHPPGRDTAVGEARRAADDAADELAVAKNAAATMRAKLGNAERRVGDAQKAIMTCTQNVLAAKLPQLLEEARSMQIELEGKRQVLAVLDRIAQSGTINPAQRDRDIDSFLSAPVFPYSFNGGDAEDHPAAAPWLEALEALQTDADAPLPT